MNTGIEHLDFKKGIGKSWWFGVQDQFQVVLWRYEELELKDNKWISVKVWDSGDNNTLDKEPKLSKRLIRIARKSLANKLNFMSYKEFLDYHKKK